MLTPVEPTEADESFLVDFERDEYKVPLNFGSSFDEYSFSLEGAMYKMPIPLDEMLKNGWVANEKLPDNEDRKEIVLEKGGKKIFSLLRKINWIFFILFIVLDLTNVFPLIRTILFAILSR